VVLLAWFRFRGQGRPRSGVRLPRSSAVEVTYLALATVYSLTLPLKRTVTLFDLVVLVAIFVAYTLRIFGAPPEEPNLVGPSRSPPELPPACPSGPRSARSCCSPPRRACSRSRSW